MRVLTGKEIAARAAKGEIFRANFVPSHCDTMFYSLTLGYLAQSVSRRQVEFARMGSGVVIGPGEVVNVELHERLNLRDEDGHPRYGGLIVAQARLLAAGISHPATVADPGSTRATYLTLINHTNFPGPRLLPGRSKIAKMIVFMYEEGEDLPDAWAPTEPYVEVGEDEMPHLWAPRTEAWLPARELQPHDLDDLRENYGPPYDIIAAALRELGSRQDVLSREVSLGREQVDVAVRQADYLGQRLQDARDKLERVERETEQVNRARQWRLGIVAALAIALLSTTLGALLAIWLR